VEKANQILRDSLSEKETTLNNKAVVQDIINQSLILESRFQPPAYAVNTRGYRAPRDSFYGSDKLSRDHES
jgi:hypothetical protein